MHLKTDKKLNFFFYTTLIIILTSVNNYNLKNKNTFNIKDIEVNGFSIEKNLQIKYQIENILGKKIFFLSKNYFVKLIERNDVKETRIKKIYPNKIVVNFISAKPICIVENQSNRIILGDNGKTLDIEVAENNLPTVLGSDNIKNIFEVINLLKKSNLDYQNIRNIIFFKSERFDIDFKNGVTIKFPLIYSKEIINYSNNLLNNDKFINSKVIDLRLKNRIIKYE
mgnify:FL=1